MKTVTPEGIFRMFFYTVLVYFETAVYFLGDGLKAPVGLKLGFPGEAILGAAFPFFFLAAAAFFAFSFFDLDPPKRKGERMRYPRVTKGMCTSVFTMAFSAPASSSM